MIPNAMRLWRASATGALILAALPCPAAAQQPDDTEVSLEDIATAPLNDLNLWRDPIPQALLSARLAPYASDGLEDCKGIRKEIGDLDAVLGEDVDTAAPDEGQFSAGKAARDMFTRLIPYRNVIRELTGAAEYESIFRQAMVAGLMRRAYLKGLGQAKNCPYPARPSLSGIFVTAPEERTGGEPHFISEPVIEPIPERRSTANR